MLNVLINNGLDGAGACYIALVVNAGNAAQYTLYLQDDSGYNSLTSFQFDGDSTVSNSQCTLDAAGSSVSGTGSTLTLVLSGVYVMLTDDFHNSIRSAVREGIANSTNFRAEVCCETLLLRPNQI